MKTFVALYIGTASPEQKASTEISEETRAAGMAAWGDWMARHAAEVVDAGAPLGSTKRISKDGVTDIRNTVTGYVVVRAESHEAAARMFESHPHFSIFPGDSVEIMECLAIPGA